MLLISHQPGYGLQVNLLQHLTADMARGLDLIGGEWELPAFEGKQRLVSCMGTTFPSMAMQKSLSNVPTVAIDGFLRRASAPAASFPFSLPSFPHHTRFSRRRGVPYTVKKSRVWVGAFRCVW